MNKSIKILNISSKIHNYAVYFENNFDFLAKLNAIENKVIVIDKNVYNLYSELLDLFDKNDIFLFDAIEENKTFQEISKIYDFLLLKSAKRNITIITIGGGITQDVTGFVASTLYRGVKWILIPTTFLSQTDSCIGSKTSINYNSYKNLMGTFYPPNEVYINTDFLTTLTEKDFYSGIGEIIKFQLLKEEFPKDFDHIINMIESIKNDKSSILPAMFDTLNVKIAYMSADEFDTGKRNLLNYGHCFGHALETVSKYEIPHGIAVTIGMIFANIASVLRGNLSIELYHDLNQRLFLPNIPVSVFEQYLAPNELLGAMQSDKKREGKDLSLVLPHDKFTIIKVNNFTEEEFQRSLAMLHELLIK